MQYEKQTGKYLLLYILYISLCKRQIISNIKARNPLLAQVSSERVIKKETPPTHVGELYNFTISLV